MAETEKILTYKGKPLMRSDNEIYYGSSEDKFILALNIVDEIPSGDITVANRVKVTLISNDTTLPFDKRIIRSSEKHGIYNALEIGSIWLEKANATF